MDDKSMKFLIYSKSEDGYWSNEDGWVDRQSATVFEEQDVEELNLPQSTGNDAQWIPEMDSDL